MPIRDYQSLMLPTLKALALMDEMEISRLRKQVALVEGYSEQDLRELLPSGQQTIFVNRVSWAINYMMRAGLAERVSRGRYRITEVGRQLLDQDPERIDIELLKSYESFAEWKGTTRSQVSQSEGSAPDLEASSPGTPEEALEQVVQQLVSNLEGEVLSRVRSSPPHFLERVIVNLLVAMGYGGGDATRGSVTGRSGDGGIDGKISEDALGLDEVYIQAKKYAEGSLVGEADLRNFAGAIDAAGTTKGVFVTTSGFTRSARSYLERSPKRIKLIDGKELARLMVRHGVGVRVGRTYSFMQIDEQYYDYDT